MGNYERVCGNGIFVTKMDLEDALADAKDDFERQLFGDGTGKMATCTAQTAVSTIVVDDTKFFAEGQIIDIVAAADGTPKAIEREIIVVDHVAKSLKLSGAAVTTAATDIVVRSGNFGLEITGLGAMFKENNTVYGIDRSIHKWFNPTVINTVGTISEIKIQNAIDEAERRAGGNVNIMAGTYGVRRAYQELLTATKRTVDTMKLKGGYSALLFNDIPITVSKYAPGGTLYGLDMSTIKMYQIMDYQWLDEDGAVLSRVAGKPVWAATLAKYADTGINKPAGSYVMNGITER